MKRLLLFSCLAGALTSAQSAQDIKRLSPVPAPSQVPTECRVVSVVKDSPAQKAGIEVGDILQSVNGQVPPDASGFAERVSAAPQDSDFKVVKATGPVQDLHIHLNQARPRLGAVCDLTGWRKSGVTAAGNESVTVFNGPFALTVSGIMDKGFVFVRVRLANDSDQPLPVAASSFIASDGAGSVMTLLSPKNVMCLLYGEKGAHLLGLKKKKKETLDTHEGNLLGADTASDERCDTPLDKGRAHKADSSYAEANATYVAEESLWPGTLAPGQVADGLIYFEEAPALPLTIQAQIPEHALSAQLALPVPSGKVMTRSELRHLFEAQKKGNSLRLTLKKGKIFVGRFSTFDPIEERVWFDTPSGMLNTTSYSLEAIRSAEPLDQLPSKPGPDAGHLN